MKNMDSFSEIYKNKRKKMMLNKIMAGGLNASAFILLTLFEMGKISLEAFHPKKYAFTALGRAALGLDKKECPWKDRTLINNLSKLIEAGLVQKDKKKNFCILTNKGKNFSIFVNDYFSTINQKWDGYLRMVFYDIPMSKSAYRQWLYNNLSLLGYKQIQRSVFIGKYPLPESFIRNINDAELDDYLYISIIKNITNKKEIIKLLKD